MARQNAASDPTTLSQYLFSVVFWLFLTVSSITLFPIALLLWLLTVAFDRRLRALHLFTCFWASLYTWLNPNWRVTVEGRENIDSGQTYVMVANHQSFLDVFVLFRIFAHFKWVSKIENFRVPCIGWNMSLNRYIKLVRGSQASVATMMTNCEQALAAQNSIMMFPEGTRSRDGTLRRFKPGAFVLAKRARVPLLPIVVEGTNRALPTNSLILRGRHPIRIRILPALAYADWSNKSADQLADEVRQLFAHALGQAPQTSQSLRSPLS